MLLELHVIDVFCATVEVWTREVVLKDENNNILSSYIASFHVHVNVGSFVDGDASFSQPAYDVESPWISVVLRVKFAVGI